MVLVLKKVSILGSTGSVGKNTLEVVSKLHDKFNLHAISCNKNISLLHDQIIKYKPRIAVITNHEKYKKFLKEYGYEIGVTRNCVYVVSETLRLWTILLPSVLKNCAVP